MKITKTRLKKIISEELRADVYSKSLTREGKHIANKIHQSTGLDKSSITAVISSLGDYGLIKEEIDSGASYGPVNLVKKQRDRPDLLPNAVQDPHVGGYNSDPAANINNLQVASRILEDLPLEELPETVSDAAYLLRQSLDELYEQNPDVGFGEPSDTEPPHFHPDKG